MSNVDSMGAWNRRGQTASLRRALFSIMLMLGLPLPAAVRAAPSIERELRSALTAFPHREARMGAYVIDLATGRTIFVQNADAPLVPASSMKVFAMAAALVELGPEFSFQTVLATDGMNLCVIGDGDPAFGDEKIHRVGDEPITADFKRWATLLLEHGIASIPGDLVIDESIFDEQWTHPSWEESDLDNWYAAPVGGLNFNDNCVDITVTPQEKRDLLVRVTVQPETALVNITNKCRSGGSGTPVLHHPHDTFEYLISGRCPRQWRFGPVSFPDPGLLFADSLRTILAKKGIGITGTIRRERLRLHDGTLPPTLAVVARRATPIADVLRRAGKDSQNLFAECLLKRAGYAWAKRRGSADPRGSWSVGRKATLDLVERAGIDTTGLVVADGSGLSRDNACTARQLASLLAWMHAQPSGRLLHDNLAVTGVDGSLRKRLTDLAGLVHAKTGTMRGVRTLAGYVDGDSGARYAFAVMFNGYKGPSTPYKQIQDRVCRILVNAAAARGINN